MDYQVLKVTDLQQCQLCLNNFESLSDFQCIEETLKICKDCFAKIQINRRNKFYIEIHQRLFIINYSSNKYYMLQSTKCQICQENKICSKMCKDEHFFCLDCTKNYFETHLQNSFIQCAKLKCYQIIDHYIIALFIKQEKIQEWLKIEELNICTNKLCENEIKFSPHSRIISQVIHYQNSTKHKIESLHFIKNQSNIIWIEPLYFIKKKCIVLQCSKCRCQNYNEKWKSIIQCYVCRIQYCKVCKSSEEQLFSQLNPLYNFCYQCQRRSEIKDQIKITLLIICFPVWILFLLIYLLLLIVQYLILVFFFLAKRFTNFIKIKWQDWNFKYKYQIFYLLLPLIIIFVLIDMFLNYGIKLLQYMINIMTCGYYQPRKQRCGCLCGHDLQNQQINF